MVCNARGGADLHIHSTASDGTCSPSQIVALAIETGLSAIAITDHDTVAGAADAVRLDISPSLKLLTGVEISADPPETYPGPSSFHVLGYGVRLNDNALNEALSSLQQSRKNRNPLMLQRLRQLGIDISMEKVKHFADSDQIGRPHIASYLLHKGIVSSMDEAFAAYIGAGSPAYVPKKRLSVQAAIRLIAGAGGIPVLAHPGLLRRVKKKAFGCLLQELVALGLMGIEAYYPEHSPAQTEFFLNAARNYRLLVTGGTDFHGDLTPEISMGCGKGDFFVPLRCYMELNRRLEALQPELS